MRLLRRAITALSLCAGWLAAAAPALAQNYQDSEYRPVEVNLIDENGVNLANRTFSTSHSISIGAAEGLGLGYTLSYVNGGPRGAWRLADQFRGEVLPIRYSPDGSNYYTYQRYAVTFGGQSESFAQGTMGPGDLGGRIQQVANECHYLRRDGVRVVFAGTCVTTFTVPPPNSLPPAGQISFWGKVQRVERPNGEVWTFHYNTQVHRDASGLVSVVSNTGYVFRFTFSATSGSGLRPTGAVLYNASQVACSYTALSCSTPGGWPRLTWTYLGASARIASVTNAAGEVVTYSYTDVNAITVVDGPGTLRTDIEYTFFPPEQPGGQITGGVDSVTRGGTTWSYYEPPNTFDMVVKTTPVSTETWQLRPNEAGGVFVGSIMNGVGQTRGYGYDPAPEQGILLNVRLTLASEPSGLNNSYEYDVRGNVVRRVTTSPVIGETPIEVRITYGEGPTTATCVNWITCNLPTVVTDGRGYSVRMTWDQTTGQLLSEEQGLQGPPTALTCALGSSCPLTRHAYEARTAQYYGPSGTLITGAPISMRVSTATCPVANPCSASDEVRETLAYGFGAAANRLLVSSSTSTGQGLSAVTAFTYDLIGNVTSIDGPRTDVQDVVYTTYDLQRRPVFEIGPDPDGAGALPRTITRHIYDARGLETRTETGAGFATNGSDFVAEIYAARMFDRAGRETLSTTGRPQ